MIWGRYAVGQLVCCRRILSMVVDNCLLVWVGASLGDYGAI